MKKMPSQQFHADIPRPAYLLTLGWLKGGILYMPVPWMVWVRGAHDLLIWDLIEAPNLRLDQ